MNTGNEGLTLLIKEIKELDRKIRKKPWYEIEVTNKYMKLLADFKKKLDEYNNLIKKD